MNNYKVVGTTSTYFHVVPTTDLIVPHFYAKQNVALATADCQCTTAGMTLNEAKVRHAQLAEEIRLHDHNYYVLAQPSISDQEYDRLYRQLLDLEKEFSQLITPDSPTQRAGREPLKAFKPVQHPNPMLN